MADKRASPPAKAGPSKRKNARVFEREDHNWYVDPPSVSDALFRVEKFYGAVADPCCGMGNILRSAALHGLRASGRDINPRPSHFRTMPGVLSAEPLDFLSPAAEQIGWENIIMNPPYGADHNGNRLEEMFIDRAIELATGKVAAVLRLGWIAPRIRWLKTRGCIRIWVIHSRPSMLPGRSLVEGKLPGGGAVDFAWFVFMRGADMTPTIDVAVRNLSLDHPSVWTWRMQS